MLAPPLSPLLLVASLAVVLTAGIARGFSGFGFSALSVAGLSLIVSPALVVPAIFVLEILASITLLRGALRDVDRPLLGWLVLGNALCIPLGVLLLAWLPETQLRLLIGALMLVAALLLRAGWHPPVDGTRGMQFVTGLVCGVVNGVAAIGGIAVALLLSASSLTPAAIRATMIALFLFTDLYALLWAGILASAGPSSSPLLGADTLRWAVWMAPAMLVGIWIGQRSFSGISPQRFRAHVLSLLTVIAVLVVGRAVLAI